MHDPMEVWIFDLLDRARLLNSLGRLPEGVSYKEHILGMFQCESTTARILCDGLVEFCVTEGQTLGVPVRLANARVGEFGLRLSLITMQDHLVFQRRFSPVFEAFRVWEGEQRAAEAQAAARHPEEHHRRIHIAENEHNRAVALLHAP